MLRIRDMLVRIRIRISGSVALAADSTLDATIFVSDLQKGSASGAGSGSVPLPLTNGYESGRPKQHTGPNPDPQHCQKHK